MVCLQSTDSSCDARMRMRERWEGWPVLNITAGQCPCQQYNGARLNCSCCCFPPQACLSSCLFPSALNCLEQHSTIVLPSSALPSLPHSSFSHFVTFTLIIYCSLIHRISFIWTCQYTSLVQQRSWFFIFSNRLGHNPWTIAKHVIHMQSILKMLPYSLE